jgi:gas vesicle protein GvpN
MAEDIGPADGPSDIMDAMVDDAASAAAGALVLRPRADLFLDEELRSLHSRAVAYLRAGAPVHLRGPAGAGKTTMALHVAAWLGRPVTLLTGDAAMTSDNLLGREVGEDTLATHDRYVHRVTKTATQTRAAWRDSALTQALQKGHTLVYDEFTRAPASANNALLSALEERVLILSNPARQERYVRAHPEFRAIFTSNPDEYAGVNAAPDALFDRMVTFDLGFASESAEAGVIARRTGLAPQDAAVVARLVRALRDECDGVNPVSLRTAILIGRLVAALKARARPEDERFVQICLDVLEARARGHAAAAPAAREAQLSAMRARILAACRGAAPGAAASHEPFAAETAA